MQRALAAGTMAQVIGNPEENLNEEEVQELEEILNTKIYPGTEYVAYTSLELASNAFGHIL